MKWLVGAALAGFGVLAVFAYHAPPFAWDLAGSRAVQSIDVPGFDGAMRAISVPGNGGWDWLIFAFAGALLVTRGLRREAVRFLGIAIGGEALNRTVKLILDRPRPTTALVHVTYVETSESFPSGHVAFYVACFGCLLLLARAHIAHRGLRAVAVTACVIPIMFVGLSRVYLGEHWPSDVLGGYLLAGAWLAITWHLTRCKSP